MKVYITKYALTSGIFYGEAEVCGSSPDTVIIRKKDYKHFDQYFSGLDWHQTKRAAIDRAAEMRDKKLISLEKQIKKIKAIDFKIQMNEA